jgi:autotransporter-associated beta strand protein
MNNAPIHRHSRSGVASRKSLSAAATALAASMLALGSLPDLKAANGTWQANPLDQGVSITLTNDGNLWTASGPLIEGDAVRVGATAGAGLTGTDTYYYVVGVGATPSTAVRFAQHPGGVGNVTGAGGTVDVPKISSWFNTGNWVGGVVPDGIDAQAAVTVGSGTPAILFDRDTTLGSLSVDTTVGALSLLATARNGGTVSTVTLKTSTGTPTITVTGGNSLSLSESKIASTTPSNANGKLFLVGNQGLVIDNQNTVLAPVALNTVPAGSYAVGAVRFGIGLNWTDFSGDLTLSRGVFQTLGGGGASTGISSLPMNSKLVLGTGSNTARLELAQSNTQSSVRGLESTSANSSIINTSGPATAGSLTFQVGSCGSAADLFTYAGNVGDTSSGLPSASAIRLVKVGPGTQILSGVNNINALTANQAMIAVNGGKLSLGTTGAVGTVAAGQGTMNANSHIQLRNGEFELSGLGVAAPRSQVFEGSVIFGAMAPASGSADANQASQSSGLNTVTVIADPAQSATLTFGFAKSRNFGGSNLNGSNTLYRGTNLGATPGAGVASINFATAPSIGGGFLFAEAGSGAASGTTQAPVIKGALADTTPTGTGMGFATYETGKGVRVLSASEQLVVASGATYDSSPTTDNLRLDLIADETINGHLSNTLEIRNTTGTARTVTNVGTSLNAKNGLLFSGSSPIILAGDQITGTADSNAEDVVVHSLNTAGVTIRTPISNPGGGGTSQGWITYNGPGDIRVEGAQTVGNGPSGAATIGGIAFNGTGNTTLATTVTSSSNTTIFAVNRGILKLDTGASWTNTPRLLLAPEAKFDFNGNGATATTNRFSDVAGASTISTLTFNASGGEVTNSAGGAPVDFILAGTGDGAANSPFFGTITGNLNLVVDKSVFNSANSTITYGSQTLAKANTYTGATKIRSGTLNLTRYGQLPTSTVVTLGASGSSHNSTLTLGDSQTPPNLIVRQEIAGLYLSSDYTGTGSVQNNSTNVSELALNIPTGVDNVFTGHLGILGTATQQQVGANQNLFVLRKKGAGSFEAAGDVTNYTGGTIIEGGVLRVSSDAKLGLIGPFVGTGAAGTVGAPAAPISAFPNQIILNGGTLQATTTADFVLNAKRGIGLGPISGSTGGTGTLWVDSGIKLTYAGAIASAGNTGSNTLVKNGAGTLALDGASAFSGVTQVSAGSLGGVGTLSSNVTVASGGALAPGNGGIGTFTIAGQLTLNSGAALNMELGAPGTSDLVQLNGALSVAGTTTINLSGLTGFGIGTYTLLSSTSPVSTSNFVIGSVPSGFGGTLSASGGVLSVTIGVQTTTALESWRQTHFGSTSNSGNGADSADPDNDGLTNLLEYATNSNPMVTGISPLTVARSGNFLTLTYTRIADGALTYTVEGSNDLVTWSTVATANNPSTGAQNTAGPVTITDTVSLTTRRFLRLKVTY